MCLILCPPLAVVSLPGHGVNVGNARPLGNLLFAVYEFFYSFEKRA